MDTSSSRTASAPSSPQSAQRCTSRRVPRWRLSTRRCSSAQSEERRSVLGAGPFSSAARRSWWCCAPSFGVIRRRAGRSRPAAPSGCTPAPTRPFASQSWVQTW
jgi:hypothetical protein